MRNKLARKILKETPQYIRLKVILWGYYAVVVWKIKNFLNLSNS